MTDDVPSELPRAWTIYEVAALKQTCLAMLDDHESLELDLGKVTDIDTAGLQLLVFLKQEAERQHKAFKVEPSERVLAVVDFLRLGGELGLASPSPEATVA